MKIEDAISIASNQFIQNFQPGNKLFQVLEKYALEELAMSKEGAAQFAKDGMAGKDVEEITKEPRHFFTWYYINYVVDKTTLS